MTDSLSPELFHRLVERCTDGVLILDSEGIILYANPASERLFGRRVDALVGSEFGLASAASGTTELRLPNPEGGAPLSVAARAIKLDAPSTGQEPGAWALVLHDLTEHKREENRLQLYEAIFLGISEAVLITRTDGTIIDLNPAFTQITGYSRDEVLGQTPTILKSGRQGADFYRSMWAVLQEEGHWKGEMWNRRKNGEIYPELLEINALTNEVGQVDRYVALFSDITHVKQTEEQIEKLLHYDALTELPNRLLFRSRLEAALNEPKHGATAVALVGVDRFNIINGTLGMETGDQILRLVAERLSGYLDEDETLARMGGDEFAVLFHGERAALRAVGFAEAIQERLSEPFHVSEAEVLVGCSLGISVSSHHGSHGISEMLREADVAMHRVKADGGVGYQLFTQDLDLAIRDNVLLAGRLGQAIAQNELRLFYQPKVSVHNGRVTGMEALVRWQHPEEGMLSPARFIPVAETSGLIDELGRWVLEHACLQAKQWLDAGLDFERVAVNMAPAQVRKEDLAEFVQQTLAATGLPADRLELEVTENTLMTMAQEEQSVLQSLRELGVSLALDDFGTGYSSLAYLRRLPAETIKIDKSFVDDIFSGHEQMAGAEIVTSIALLGQKLGFRIVAEGVETAEQVAFLRHCHCCDEIQGYFFSPPVQPEAIPALLRHPFPLPDLPDSAQR